jgi:hypothetical protein
MPLQKPNIEYIEQRTLQARLRPSPRRLREVFFVITPFGVMCMRATRGGFLARKIGLKSFRIV